MKLVTDTWRQLVQRRLWPVALLLLAALVAVPFMLKSDPAPVVPPPATVPATDAKAGATTTDPIVALASDTDGGSGRRVLGSRKDPFRHTGRQAKKAATSQPSSGGSSDNQSPSSSPSQDGAPTGGDTTPTPASTPSAEKKKKKKKKPKKTYAAYSIDVRFGSSDEDLKRMTIDRLGALPSAEQPLLVYTGVKDGGNTAVFMIDNAVTATGDADCEPADTCETIELRAGETEFFDIAGENGTAGGQFELDLIKIHKPASKAG